MFLNDKEYESGDENGRWIPREEIQTLGTYEVKDASNFVWQCGCCQVEHFARPFSKIGGSVRTCPACTTKNLLVRTDARFMDQIFRQPQRMDSETERRAIKHLGLAVSALGSNR